MQEKTLTQTTTETITPNNAVACAPTATSGNVGTLNNSYYRVFDLAAAGISGDFTVEHVTFQVEDDESIAGTGTKVTVKVGTYHGAVGTTLDAGGFSALGTVLNVQVPEVDEPTEPDPTVGATINVPVAATIPAGSLLFVEIDSPGKLNQEEFYMGTTNTGESGNSYVSSSECTPPGTTPASVPSLIGTTDKSALLLTVTGTY